MHNGTVAPLMTFSAARWLTMIVAAIAVVFIFYDGLSFMVSQWSREEYSYGYLIPPIAAVLLWQRYREIDTSEWNGAWSGLLVVLAGLVIGFFGELSTIYTVILYAFLITVFGMVLALVGWRGIRPLLAPLGYLIFMIPLPQFLYQGLSAKMQLISSELGVEVIRLLGIAVFLEGNVIDLGIYKLQVVEACNGLRYLFPLMSFGYLIAYLYKGPWWHKAVVFLSAAPFTILLNSFRIGVTGWLVEHMGIDAAEGFLHDFEGWIIFMAGVGLLFAVLWLLSRLSGLPASLTGLLRLDFAWSAGRDGDAGRWQPSRPLLATVSLLVVTALATSLVPERAEIIPPRKSFATFPMRIGDWHGREQALEQIYLDVLKLDDYALADYRRAGDGGGVNLYVAYYQSQRTGVSTHSPRSCIPGGGWEITEFAQIPVADVGPGGTPLTVNRVVIAKGPVKQLVYYWFEQRGRQMTNEYVVKWMIFWDALTENRTDGALARVTTMVNPGEDIAEADRRLGDFLRVVYPEMPAFIPN